MYYASQTKGIKESDARVSTGVAGLDEIMNQGFILRRVYLVRGGPGSGKSTLGLHFLAAGASNGEKLLFITPGEPGSQVRKNAQRIGFDLKGVSFLDLAPTPEFFTEAGGYDIFLPAEVERGPIAQKIREEVEIITGEFLATEVGVSHLVDSIVFLRYLEMDGEMRRAVGVLKKRTSSFEKKPA